MDENSLYRALGVAIWVFLSGAIVATAVWAVKRFTSRSTQWWLLSPMTVIIRHLVGRALRGSRAAIRRE